MKNQTRLFLIIIVSLAKSFSFAQTGSVKNEKKFIIKAYELLEAGNYGGARLYIDSSMNDENYIDDGQAWYLKGFIYKTIYNTQEKANKESLSRIIALAAFKKSMEVDTIKEYKEDNIANIKYLNATLYNDIAASLNVLDYDFAIRNFEIFKKYYVLVDTSKNSLIRKDVEFKSALGSVFVKFYEKSKPKHNVKYYNLAKQQYEEILKMEENYSARYNLIAIENSKNIYERADEKQKFQQELELKSSRISLLDKENQIKKIESESKTKAIELLNKDKKLQEKEKVQKEKELQQQKQMRNIFIAGLLIMIVFASIVVRSLYITRKQKTLIEQQKKEVEEKQKEILDSIHYAKRIQTALLPTEKYIEKSLTRLKK